MNLRLVGLIVSLILIADCVSALPWITNQWTGKPDYYGLFNNTNLTQDWFFGKLNWSYIQNAPLINESWNQSAANEIYVPYSGASYNVNLNSKNLTTSGLINTDSLKVGNRSYVSTGQYADFYKTFLTTDSYNTPYYSYFDFGIRLGGNCTSTDTYKSCAGSYFSFNVGDNIQKYFTDTIYVDSPTNPYGATIESAASIFIWTPSIATENYGIITEGSTASNFFGNKLKIDPGGYASIPTQALQVTGNITATEKIGIGTTTPKNALTVVGDINASNIVNASQLCIKGDCENDMNNLQINNSQYVNFSRLTLGNAVITNGDGSLNMSGNLSVVGKSVFSDSILIKQGTATSAFSQIQASSDGSGTLRGITSSLHSNAATGALFTILKSRGTNTAPTVVNASDNVGGLWGRAYNSTDYVWGGMVGFTVNGSGVTSDGSVNLDMVFTLNNGTAIIGQTTAGSERMRLANAGGNLLIGTTENNGVKLSVNGSTNITGNLTVRDGTTSFDLLKFQYSQHDSQLNISSRTLNLTIGTSMLPIHIPLIQGYSNIADSTQFNVMGMETGLYIIQKLGDSNFPNPSLYFVGVDAENNITNVGDIRYDVDTKIMYFEGANVILFDNNTWVNGNMVIVKNLSINTLNNFAEFNLNGNADISGYINASQGNFENITAQGYINSTSWVNASQLCIKGDCEDDMNNLQINNSRYVNFSKLTLGNAVMANGDGSLNMSGNFTIRDTQTAFFVNAIGGGVNKPGLVGIGTNNPAFQLEIYNNLTAAQGGSIRGLAITNQINAAAGPSIWFRKQRGTTAAPLKVSAGDAGMNLLAQPYNGSADIVTGVVGFHINTTTDATTPNVTTDFIIQTTPSGSVSFPDFASTGRVIVKGNTGNVGIGTFVPTQKLEVNGNVNITNNLFVRGNATYDAYRGGMYMHNDSGLSSVFNSTYQKLYFDMGDHNNGFNFSNSTLQLLDDGGWYQVIWKAEGEGTQNHEFHGYVFVNEVQQNNTIGHAIGEASNSVDMLGIGFVYIAKWDNVTVRMADLTAQITGKQIDANINLVRVGN